MTEAQKWGGRDVGQMASDMAEQVATIRAARPDASLTPVLKTHKLAES